MDRRQRKTREAIFNAFIQLLSKKRLSKITVGEIIDLADVGRATFYAHFETKDHLVKELCEELFCHIFDSINDNDQNHKHIFECNAPDSVYLHLFEHLQRNDNNILTLLSCEDNEIFLRYFKSGLIKLIESQSDTFNNSKAKLLPKDFMINHIASTFISTVKWWINNKMQLSAQVVTDYFLAAIN